jgi:hypothetical protein
MTERMTDEQIDAMAALVVSDVGYPGDVLDAYGYVAIARAWLESRQRRCGNCAHYEYSASGTWGTCEQLADNEAHAFVAEPDWFCADFKAKP